MYLIIIQSVWSLTGYQPKKSAVVLQINKIYIVLWLIFGEFIFCANFSYFIAPEVITDLGYSQQCDIWSLGVIMYTL